MFCCAAAKRECRLSLFGISLSSGGRSEHDAPAEVPAPMSRRLRKLGGRRRRPWDASYAPGAFFRRLEARHLRAQRLAWKSAGVLLVLIQDFTVDNCKLDALCWNDQAPAAAG